MDSLPLGSIFPSPTNPRKRFDETELNELADSIRVHGVMQPILVRPINSEAVLAGTDNIFQYEIVAGERRYRASKIAEQEYIPAIIRELDDVTALQLQILENLQRSDLHPLEEANGFKALLANKSANSWTPEQLAEKIGKSRSYVYASLKLCELCTYAQDVFLDNKIGREVALLIARIPGEKLQKEATKYLQGTENIDPTSYRNAKDYIRSTFTLDLNRASFDTHSTSLLEKAGSCLSCPKRSGNYPELFPDISSPDVCTDTACFKAKKQAHVQALIDSGQRVLVGDEAKAVKPYGANNYTSGSDYKSINDYIRIGEQSEQVHSLFGDDLPPAVYVVDTDDNIATVYETSALEQKLQEKIDSGKLVVPEKEPAEPTEHELKHKAKLEAQQLESARRDAIFAAFCKHLPEVVSINQLLRTTIDYFGQNASRDAMGLIMDQYQYQGTDFIADFQKAPQSTEDMVKLLTMLFIAEGTSVGWDWESPEDNEEDEDYQAMMTFIANTGAQLVVAHPEPETSSTPPAAAHAVDSSAPETTPEPAALAEETPAAELEKKLPPKFQEIKDKAIAKRAKNKAKVEQKESANADVQTPALT